MKANSSESVSEIMDRVSQLDILAHYFSITTLPLLINSPLREDRHPSFFLFSPDGKKVLYIDYASGEKGDIYNLLQKYFGISFAEVMRMLGKEEHFHQVSKADFKITPYGKNFSHNTHSDIRVRIRTWMKHDIEYWNTYGISLQMLKYAEVYPISHKIIYKDGQRYVFPAAKYAYCFVERKEGKVTIKVYQPFSKQYKWSNSNDGSVIGLWTKIPKNGDRLVICSSLKDALCLWQNTRIPCIYVQSETTGLSQTAQEELRKRYKRIYILFDNDPPGLRDADILSRVTGFKNIILPQFEGGKDVSDAFKVLGKEKFINMIKPLFENDLGE